MNRDDVLSSPKSAGRTKMLKSLEGDRLTRDGAIKAKCFECMNGYIDGRVDCGIIDCPLYPYMPYKRKDK